MSGPLSGYKIIEIAGIGPGPFAAMLLADMGAEVIRVERAGAVRGPAHDGPHPDATPRILDLLAEGMNFRDKLLRIDISTATRIVRRGVETTGTA